MCWAEFLLPFPNAPSSFFFNSLVSIQGLILGVEHPYYLEPGYGGWEGSHGNNAATMAHGGPSASASSITAAKSGGVDGSSSAAVDKYVPPQVRTYEDRIRMGTLKHAIGDYCNEIVRSRPSARAKTSQHYLSAFEDILQAHFWSEVFVCFSLVLLCHFSAFYLSDTLHSRFACHTPDRKECIKADAKKWISIAHSQHQKRNLQTVLNDVESTLGRLEEPSSAATDTTATASNGKTAASAKKGKGTAAAGKTPAVGIDGSTIPPEMAEKHREMEAAAAKGDYISAGRIQSQIKLSGKVHDLIVSRTQAMEDAVAKKDYVEAGRLQLIVRHLESNKMRLQDLEKRMFEYAAKQDFVKAGRFQEQYRVLMESAEAEDQTLTPGASSAAAAKAPSSALSGLASAVASAVGNSGGKMPLVMYGGGGGGGYDDFYGEDIPVEEYGDY